MNTVRELVAMAVVLASGLHALADFAGDFQKAKELFDRQQYQAAAEAFGKLALAAPNAHGEAASISLAAISLERLKQVDRAIEMARTIRAKPMAAYTQMEILSHSGRPKELIAAFKGENIAAWPDSINYKGFSLRGGAYNAVRDKRSALEDFARCVDLAGSDVWVKLEALNNVAALHQDHDDNAKAMETYQKAFAIYEDSPGCKGRWVYPQALLGAAHVLMNQGKYDEAAAVLAKYGDTSEKIRRNYWGFLVLEAHGDIFAAQGRKSAALAKYKDALAISTHQACMNRVDKKITALKDSLQRTPR